MIWINVYQLNYIFKHEIAKDPDKVISAMLIL